MTTFIDERFNVPQTDIEIEQEEPTTLTECMQYAKNNDDFEPLEFAIYTTEKNKLEAVEVIKFMRETAQASGRGDFYIKQCNKLLTILNRK